MRSAIVLLLLATLGAAIPARGLAQANRPTRVAIYVGPQVRDGFIDVDSGVVDSIKDIQDELKDSPLFSIVTKPGDAQIVLLVVGRRSSRITGTVSPTGAVAVPVYGRAIDTILRFGKYEKAITSEDETNGLWKSAAKRVAKDVTAWVEANRERIKPPVEWLMDQHLDLLAIIQRERR